MRLKVSFLFLLVFCFYFHSTLFAQSYLPKRLIVKVKDSSVDLNQLSKKISSEFPELGEVYLHAVFPSNVNSQSRLAEKTSKLNHYCKLFYSSNMDVMDAIPGLQELEEISYAQPHYLPVLAGVPNDSLIEKIRVHHELIGLYNAWEVNQGDTTIVIGIVDTGTDLDHVDLRENLSVNHLEIINGLDDDGDGYVDNRFGWDVAENDNDPQVLKSSHGVHMCGLVAAVPNNRIGVAGVGFQCRFLPVKIADDATGALVAAYEGVKYAADAGADIINCSWGSYDIGNFERDVIDYAVNVKNCLLVGAAGNDDENNLFYPAAFDEVLAVASTDTSDVKAFNSNFNSLVDISAPGVSIVSTWDDNLYQSNTGTSVASAVVAAGAALVKSRFPTYSNLEIINQLKTTADYIDLKNPEYKRLLGRGRINLENALKNEFTPDFVDVSFNIYPNPALGSNPGVNFYWYLEATSRVQIQIFDIRGELVENLIDEDFDAGIYKELISFEGFSSGLYLIRFTSDSEDIIKKLVIE